MRTALWRTLIALATTMVVTPALAFAQTESIRIGKKGEIEITQPTRFGDSLLPAGHYEVQHTSLDGQHYVVIKDQEPIGRRHTVRATGDEVARVRCQIVVLGEPARSSVALWTKGKDGKPIVTEIRIADEPAGHIVVLQPSGDK
jgi:hypothetical protein